ncbi:MAG TPA: GIY-YIG nuclease family protein [Candidatus Saccharimonadales bacterium]|nr:GIY-YIG nuclease family protein [Candidatus Saccharimonadales bacterium]
MNRKVATSIPGIYLITNTISGKVYVGQAINIRRRWESHRHYLTKGEHRNSYLQRSWTKHGPDKFIFSVLVDLSAIAPDQLCVALNKAEIDALAAFPNTYNLMQAGISAPVAGPETRAIWSEQRKAMWSDPGFRESQSRKMKEHYASNPEWKARRDASVAEALRTPEQRNIASERFKALWQNPEHQKAQSANRKANWQDPAYKEQQSASRRAAWADPEVRQRRVDAIKAAHARRRIASTSD